jgi:hypothetical protein
MCLRQAQADILFFPFFFTSRRASIELQWRRSIQQHIIIHLLSTIILSPFPSNYFTVSLSLSKAMHNKLKPPLQINPPSTSSG